MKEIKAFVGHSFSPEDADVVSAFLRYFEGLSKSHPQFSWDHAEKAEPRQLTEKVLRIISDKNVFIGICTRKEKAISSSAVSKKWFLPGYEIAKTSDFRWKTSDWIIQEIGMAVGKGLELILLVEEGVDDPGGLQGDVEYIPFQRNAPEKSFLKILEMITALTPKSATALTGTVSIEANQGDEETEKDFGAEMLTPQPSWTRTEYEIGVFHALYSDKDYAVDSISTAYLESADASVFENVESWEGYIEFARIFWTKGGSFERLKNISAKFPKNPTVLSYVARIHSLFEQHHESAIKYTAAAELTHIADKQASYLRSAAKEYAANGDFETAKATIEKIRSKIDAATERPFLEALREVAEMQKHEDIAVAAMECMVEIKPDDFATRFQLAFKQSELGNEDVAMHHYLQIPYGERTAIAWNNLGVTYAGFKMPMLSVKAYKKAAEMGETLAMSNLGNALLNAGFIEEAKGECDRALAVADRHKNIPHLLARLADEPDKEDAHLKEILATSKQKIEFYKELGKASSSATTPVLGKHWTGPDCKLHVEQTNGLIQMHGAYEKDSNSFYLAVFGSSPAASTKVKHRIEYAGILTGRCVFADVKRIEEGGAPRSIAAEALGMYGTKVLMIVSEDGKKLMAMENPYSTTPKFYEIRLDVEPLTLPWQVETGRS